MSLLQINYLKEETVQIGVVMVLVIFVLCVVLCLVFKCWAILATLIAVVISFSIVFQPKHLNPGHFLLALIVLWVLNTFAVRFILPNALELVIGVLILIFITFLGNIWFKEEFPRFLKKGRS